MEHYINYRHIYITLFERVGSDRSAIVIFPDKYDLFALRKSLRFFLPDKNIIVFPAWDCLPYEMTSPSPGVTALRIQALYDIVANKKDVAVISNQYAISQKLPPLSVMERLVFFAYPGNTTRSDIMDFLGRTGYYAVPTATNAGEFAERASIIDVISGNIGYRLNFDYEMLEAIRLFDPNTQNSIGKTEKAILYSSSEVIAGTVGMSDVDSDDPIVREFVRGGIRKNGLERFLRRIYKDAATIFDYLPSDTDIFTVDAEKIRGDYVYGKLSRESDESGLYLPIEEINRILKMNEIAPASIEPIRNFYSESLTKKEKSSFVIIMDAMKNRVFSDKIVIVLCNTPGMRDRIIKAFEAYGVNLKPISSIRDAVERDVIYVAVADADSGFIYSQYYFISEKEILGRAVVGKKYTRKSQLLLSAFEIGDVVVHEDYGIGRFNGIQSVVLGNKVRDFIAIMYADDNKLMIPVENINLISKYGQGKHCDVVSLDKLGGVSWQNRKARLKRKIHEISKSLIAVAAKRKEHPSRPVVPHGEIFERFCLAFPYIETDDQINAIADIRDDLSNGTFMDRLICGEAGFGKTEVAIRAAFMVIKNDENIRYQVAVLVPSTLLCSQNFHTFLQRMEGFDCNIAQMSRITGAKHNARVIEGLGKGDIDIVIATQALLRDDIRFKNLKMLIIDEEQAFGVKQKEKLKMIKPDIHVLSLSATPIPRTLYMSLAGIKDLSVIATPPIEKGSVETIVCEYSEQVIVNAISREIHRKGQVFYICPKIQLIGKAMERLITLFPTLNILSAHGQMPGTRLEEVMTQFYNGKCDILVTTTIVESGLNILNANTMIIESDQYLGVSQLCQLRGRVGRHHAKGYAYVMLPLNVSDQIARRISVIKHLNSGFAIASHDMDERGFGNILGHEQSGNVKEVGIELYQKMLEDEVSALKTDTMNTNINPEVNLGISISIPRNYISDDSARLMLYREAAMIETIEQIDNFAASMIDRFGDMPQEALNLLKTLKYKIWCKKARISKIVVGEGVVTVLLFNNSFPDHDGLMDLMIRSNGMIRFTPKQEIIIKKFDNDLSYTDKFIRCLMELVANHDVANKVGD